MDHLIVSGLQSHADEHYEHEEGIPLVLCMPADAFCIALAFNHRHNLNICCNGQIAMVKK